MPFGYKNGPSIFQRIMQNVLAPFLWIFALVYIDDIVIFSKSFDEHLDHLDQVFKAVAETGITLATMKCHFTYQSLLLLGQKVSRLGLSTHMEKVSTILNLDEPKNIHDLQIFLGMMVYFSSYKSGCGRTKTSTRTNEQREWWVHTYAEGRHTCNTSRGCSNDSSSSL